MLYNFLITMETLVTLCWRITSSQTSVWCFLGLSERWTVFSPSGSLPHKLGEWVLKEFIQFFVVWFYKFNLLAFVIDVVNLNLKSTLRVLYNLFTNYKSADWWKNWCFPNEWTLALCLTACIKNAGCYAVKLFNIPNSNAVSQKEATAEVSWTQICTVLYIISANKAHCL